MTMNLPALATITLPARMRRLAALELLHTILNSWRADGKTTPIRLPTFNYERDTQECSVVLNRVKNMVSEAERDGSLNRLGQLDTSIAEVLRQTERDFRTSGEHGAEDWTSIAAALENGDNPFALRQALSEIDSAFAYGLSEATHRYDEVVVVADDAFQMYEKERDRAQNIDNLRSSVQPGASSASESAAHFYVFRLAIAAVIALLAGYMVLRFIGGGWLVFTGATATVLIILSLFVLRQRGQDLQHDDAGDEQQIFPAEFKRAISQHVAARLNQFAADNSVRRIKALQLAWANRSTQSEFGATNDKLEEVSVLAERALEDAPAGYFNEFLPGDILLYGRGVARMVASSLSNRIGLLRLRQTLMSEALADKRESWHGLVRGRTAGDLFSELTRAAETVLGDLEFSALLSDVWGDPEGAAATDFWLDRVRQEVMAASGFREGFSREQSDVKEILSCGLPNGMTDVLAGEMKKRFGGEIHQATTANALELVCVARNVRLDELLSTPALRDAYEEFDPKVRSIYFDFQSHGNVVLSSSDRILSVST